MSIRSCSTTPKAKCQCSKSKAMITSNDDDMELETLPAVPEPAPALVQPTKLLPLPRPIRSVLKQTPTVVVVSECQVGMVPNPVPKTGPTYLEIYKLDEEELINIGRVPKMRAPYVEIPSASRANTQVTGPTSGLEEDEYADLTLPVWSPAHSSCVQWGGICFAAKVITPAMTCLRGKESATPTKSRKPGPTINHTQSKSCCQSSKMHVIIITDDEAAECPSPSAVTTAPANVTTTPTSPTIATPASISITAPAIAASATSSPATASSTSTTANTTATVTVTITTPVPMPDSQNVLTLKEDVAVLQTIVVSLLERVNTSEQLLQEANWQLSKQEASGKLLTNQVTILQQELHPSVESSATEILPILMRTSKNGQVEYSTALPPSRTMSVTTNTDMVVEAPAADATADAAQEILATAATNVEGDSQGELPLPKDQLASIASTAHE
ncbi:hypothetical protein BDR07DRAFT_1483845 [Suillus spraguei]|nr:hypothetical protein BDR07DRAFT_1483845 [Suillus spraguei]